MTDGRRDLQFQYNLLNLPTVTETLESIAHDEGRFVALSASPGTTTAQFIDIWHVRDYLGSVRTVLDITRNTAQVSDPALAILEQDDYMPSGIRVNLAALAYDHDCFNCSHRRSYGPEFL